MILMDVSDNRVSRAVNLKVSSSVRFHWNFCFIDDAQACVVRNIIHCFACCACLRLVDEMIFNIIFLHYHGDVLPDTRRFLELVQSRSQ